MYFFLDWPPAKLKSYGICHLHFTKDMYCLPAMKPLLRSEAKPTVNLGDLGCVEPSAFHSPLVGENSPLTNELQPSNIDEPNTVLEPAESPPSSSTCKSNIALEPIDIFQQEEIIEPNYDTQQQQDDTSLSRILCDSNNVSLQDDFLTSNRTSEPNTDTPPSDMSPSSSTFEPNMCQDDCFQSRIVAVPNNDLQSSMRRTKWRSVGRVSYLCKNAQMYHGLWTKVKKQRRYEQKKENKKSRNIKKPSKKINPKTVTKEELLQLIDERFEQLTDVQKKIMFVTLTKAKQ